MKPSDGQKQIVSFVCERGGQATFAEICNRFSREYYLHGEKHVSHRLSRMVKQGLLTRIKKGVYAVGGAKKTKEPPPGTLTLF